MGRKLYEIDFDIASCWDPETGEILDYDALQQLELERDKKIEGIALWAKELAAETEMIRAEEERLCARRKQKEKQVESLKGWLSYVLEGKKFETPRTAVSFRRSESVKVLDELLIPKDYMKEKIMVSPDKAAIKKILKDGGEIPGCELEEKDNVSIR